MRLLHHRSGQIAGAVLGEAVLALHLVVHRANPVIIRLSGHGGGIGIGNVGGRLHQLEAAGFAGGTVDLVASSTWSTAGSG